MALRSHAHQKASPDTASTTVQHPSRPFAPQTKLEAEQTQTLPELQTQLETAQRFGHHLADFRLSPNPSSLPLIQPKLAIGAPGDKYEQEADRVAQQVVQRLNAPQVKRAQPEAAVQRQTPEDEELQMKPMLQLRGNAKTGRQASPDLESAINQARGGGRSLDAGLQRSMGQAMGANFSGVRVHTDDRADQLNRSIQAKAFTTGQDVFFRQGAYQPGSRGGQELLAHELTHVKQQSGGAVQVQKSANQSEEDIITQIPPAVTAPPEEDIETAPPVTAQPQPIADDHAHKLPTKAEAIREGGKPGHRLGIGKTNYGRLLEALDQFHSIDVSNKDAQAQKIIEMQSLIARWLQNPDREKGKEGDRAKQDLIERIKPIVKGEVFEPNAINAAKNATFNEQVIREKLLKKQLTANQQSIARLLDRVSQASLTTNFGPEKLEFFLKSKELKNAFQTVYKNKSPGGDLGEELGGLNQREDAERYLGYSPFTEAQRENRPNYVGVNVLNNPRGAVPGYGKFYFVWNNNVKKRATYTPYDSFVMRSEAKGLKGIERGKTIATNEHVQATLAYNDEMLLALAKMLQGQELAKGELRSPYIEAAIHGGLSLNDVAELVIPFPQNTQDPTDMHDKQYVDEFNQKHPHIRIRYST
jgi:Domain of unknown function (DUF4157)/Protein of unknown function (DUF3626)